LILLAIAAFAQAGSLDAHPRDAAILCAAATQQSTGPSTVRLMSQVSYYITAAVRADPQDKPFHERYLELFREMPGVAQQFHTDDGLRGRAAAIAAECDVRWPLARRQGPAQLLIDPRERDFMCFTIIQSLLNAARRFPPGGAPTLEELEPAYLFYDGLVRAGMRERGIGDLPTMFSFGQASLASLDVGNSEAIGRGCMGGIRGDG
jgi:hypothetical protein